MPISTTPITSKNSHLSEASDYSMTKPRYTFEDIILPDEIWEQIEDIIALQKNYKLIYEEWGLGRVIKQPKHIYVNLYGKPGTGKTMVAHALANILNKMLMCVDYASIESKYVGETAKNLVRLFDIAQEKDAIILFDEADALLSRRVTNMSNSTDVSVNQTRSVLLTLLDEYEGMIIFTTNFISNFDAAFMRRINYHIYFPLPNQELRLHLWKHYIPQQMPVIVDFEELAQKYDGVSGNDIMNAVVMAALHAARIQAESIPQNFFEDAIKSIKLSMYKNAFKKDNEIYITENEVSEEYVQEQLGKEGEK